MRHGHTYRKFDSYAPLLASRGMKNVCFSIYVKISCLPKHIFFSLLDGVSYVFFAISFGMVVVLPFPKKTTNLPRMIIYTVRENHTGPAVSEILRYRQTFCYFIIRMYLDKLKDVLLDC